MRIIAIALLWLGMLGGGVSAQESGSGWLGVELKDITKAEADALGWEAPRGAKVVKPVPGSPADAAGLQVDDILVSLDGMEVANAKAFTETVRQKPAGAEIKLAILRAGREKRLGLKLGARPAALAAAKPVLPLPMLDTGGHMALIRSIAFTPDGKQLVSASEDKTIRVWDIATGLTLRTIRGQAQQGLAGAIGSMALSPNGKWLAAGGWFPGERLGGSVLRLYEFATGKLVALLRGHESGVHGLAFSPDSRLLISGSEDNTAIIWDTGGLPAASGAGAAVIEPLHRLAGHGDAVHSVGFTPDGARAVTSSFDRDLRLWRVADGFLLRTMRGHQSRVLRLAVSPAGYVASGDLSGEIRLWDGQTGDFLKVLARQGTIVGSLSFAPDGRLLLSGIVQVNVNKPSGANVFDAASGRKITAYHGHDNNVAATAISPDGYWAATGGGQNLAIHIWNLRTGEQRSAHGQPLIMGGKGHPVWAVGFSADGRQIGWGHRFITTPNQATMLAHVLTLPLTGASLPGPQPLASEEAGSFRRAEARHGAWSLSHRKGGKFGFDAILDVSEGGKVRASIERDENDGLVHRSYTFTPDGETIISGASNRLSAYGRSGRKLGDFHGHEGDIFALATSADGRYLVSGSSDQTVRLWNCKTRELLVTIFRGEDGEWAIWTPQGFYAASPAGARLIGWQINRGVEHEAEYFTAAQLRQHMNRPDIVARAIQLASAEEAVKEARGADFKIADLLAKPAPRLRILSPEPDATLKGGSAQVRVQLEATPDPVKIIRIQVNGRQVAEKLPQEGAPGIPAGTYVYDVPLVSGANKIAVAAVNDTGETVASVSVANGGEGDLDRRGTLYILAIGVDEYPNFPGKDLLYAGADAKAFAETMEKRAGPLHTSVVKRVLVNGGAASDSPTAANILDALGLLHSAGQNDTVMLFLSGHGVNEGPNYRFAPTDAAPADTGFLRPASVVPWFAFQEALTGANGRRILFLDTCHAANAFNQRLLSDSYEANIMVYSSARSDQEALEDGALGGGHGLFTYSLVEGVNGGARDHAGEVRADGLQGFVKDRVAALAAKLARQQEPQYFRARDADNYVLARP